MKDQNVPVKSSGETVPAKKKETRSLRGGATAIIQQFKERQRLPVLTIKDWPGNGPELGKLLPSLTYER